MLDLSRVLAGPFCTMILAQLGARVIKVERPGAGDDSRAFGPFVNGKSLYFSSINYDKESIALDLKQPADRAMFEELLGVSDVVVENFRPGTMEKLGYGWDTLHAKYPNLIYGAASGFGDSGPYSKRAAYDMVVQGMGGIMSMTGQPDSPPTRVGVSIGDLAAGLYLAIGLIAAIQKRSQGGGAVKVDIAMLDCQLALLEDALAAFSSLGEIAQPHGSRHPEIAPFQAYRTADSYVVIAAGNDHLFGLMAQAIGRPDLLENPNYKTNALRHSNVDALEDDMEKTLRKQPDAGLAGRPERRRRALRAGEQRLPGVSGSAGGGPQHAGLDRRPGDRQADRRRQSIQDVRRGGAGDAAPAARGRRRSRRDPGADQGLGLARKDPDMALIQSSLADGVGTIAFDNYAHRNALSAALIAEAIAALDGHARRRARRGAARSEARTRSGRPVTI